MDKQRAQYLLRMGRPNGADDRDPLLAEAFDQVPRDEKLKAWFAGERAVDRAVAAKLREVRAPAELRQQILAGLAASGRQFPRRVFLNALAALAAAASVALAIYTAWPTARPSTLPFATIVATAVQDFGAPATFSIYESNPAEVRAWLERQQAPVPGALPGSLARLPTIGGRIATWQGVRASAVGLEVPAPSDRSGGRPGMLQLFTVHQTSCASGSASLTPVVFMQDARAVATWRDATNYYVLVTDGSMDSLRAVLGLGPAVARQAGTRARPPLADADA